MQEESEKNADLEKELATESNLRKKAETKLSEYEKAEQEAKEEAKSGIVVTLIKKENEPEKRFFTGSKEIYLDFCVENNTDKEITGVSGLASFYDVFGVLIKTMKCDLVKTGMQPGASEIFNMSYNCNLYIDAENKLVSTEFENMTMKYEILKVVYSDGTEVNYG